MHYIATAALVVIAGCAVVLTREARRFTYHLKHGPVYIGGNVHVLFNPEIVELIRNWRRSPRAKKEKV